MQFRKMVSVLALALSLAMAVSAQAQGNKVEFPKGLQWQTMDLLAFDFNFPGYEGTPESRKLAAAIWAPTLEGLPPHESGGKYPAFVNIAAFESGGNRYIFSILSAASLVYPQCEDPPNSSAINTPIYAICPMRVVIQSLTGGQTTQQDFPRYCNITSNEEDQPKSRNFEQVAFDAKNRMAYVRVVQYGKPAPECNRAIKLP